MKDYEELLESSKKPYTLSSVLSLLTWDQETYMPHQGTQARSSQIALISSLIHEAKTSDTFRKQLEKLIDIETGKVLKPHLSSIQKAALREWRKDYLRLTKLPVSFVHQFSETTSLATQIWAKARKENDFNHFAPTLEKIVDLCRKKADILGYTEHPYDALVDLYEPSMKTSTLIPLFTNLEKGLKTLVKKLSEKTPINDGFLFNNYSRDKQILFGNLVLDKLNIDRNYMRLDESTHPFSTSLHPTDNRITTRILPHNLLSNIYSILHEAGHGLYEMGLPVEYFGTPICEATSIGIHESQSRWWETRIGKSLPFWVHFYPLLQDTFPQLDSISFDHFYKAIHAVKPSLIRIESDEVSYCLHVLLRFDIEKALIEGSLPVKDIPSYWREKMKDLLGIIPQTDTEGCLQDIHWSCGDFGYFPTYALGNLYASHFFESFEKEHPNWGKNVEKGEFNFIKEYLRENIHHYGRTYSPQELTEKLTGKPLCETAYLNYLNKKYLKIYG